MVLSLIITIFLFVVVNGIGFLSHRYLHNPKAGELYKAHVTHHTLYTINDFYSDKYRSAEKDNTVYFFAILSFPIICIIISLYAFGLISLGWFIYVACAILLFGGVNNTLHDLCHLNNHWVRKIPIIRTWILYLDDLHYLHHQDTTKNFGIYNFFWDRIFGSFKE